MMGREFRRAEYRAEQTRCKHQLLVRSVLVHGRTNKAGRRTDGGVQGNRDPFRYL